MVYDTDKAEEYMNRIYALRNFWRDAYLAYNGNVNEELNYINVLFRSYADEYRGIVNTIEHFGYEVFDSKEKLQIVKGK